MEIISTLEELKRRELRPSAAALGTFDGLHRGHQKVIETTQQFARQNDLISMVFTFCNHPMATLMPELEPARLLLNEDKIEILRSMGIDVLINIPFDLTVAHMSAEHFLVLLQQKGVRAVGIGMNFSFGAGGSGNVQYLDKVHTQYGMTVLSCPLLTLDGDIVSSTNIRSAIKNGEMHKANYMLGRPYVIRGIVSAGQQRGRRMGFPTANLELADSHMAIPAYGVYAGQVLARGQWYKAMLNVGNNPTFGNESVRLEAHLFGFSGDLYGQSIAIKVLDRIREEKKFANMELLMKQLEKDQKAILLKDF
jgi:riboflavin kinase/FMN adenylyltransferase